MHPWTIRDARPDDREVIVDFNVRLAEESEGKRLDSRVVRQGVAALLEDCSKGRYFLATDQEEIVGQLSITYEWSDWRNGMIWWIQSVYVRAEYRGRGVFGALFRHVEGLGRRDPGVLGLRLYVEDENRRAHSAYRKAGLSRGGYFVMERLWIDDLRPPGGA